jgi:hypothetical protein
MIIHPAATATATILPEQENMISHLRPGSNTNVTHFYQWSVGASNCSSLPHQRLGLSNFQRLFAGCLTPLLLGFTRDSPSRFEGSSCWPLPGGNFHEVLADCGTSLPRHDAAVADHGKPRLFHRSANWKKVMDDFFHGQLEELLEVAEVASAAGGSLVAEKVFTANEVHRHLSVGAPHNAPEGFAKSDPIDLIEKVDASRFDSDRDHRIGFQKSLGRDR